MKTKLGKNNIDSVFPFLFKTKGKESHELHAQKAWAETEGIVDNFGKFQEADYSY